MRGRVCRTQQPRAQAQACAPGASTWWFPLWTEPTVLQCLQPRLLGQTSPKLPVRRGGGTAARGIQRNKPLLGVPPGLCRACRAWRPRGDLGLRGLCEGPNAPRKAAPRPDPNAWYGGVHAAVDTSAQTPPFAVPPAPLALTGPNYFSSPWGQQYRPRGPRQQTTPGGCLLACAAHAGHAVATSGNLRLRWLFTRERCAPHIAAQCPTQACMAGACTRWLRVEFTVCRASRPPALKALAPNSQRAAGAAQPPGGFNETNHS